MAWLSIYAFSWKTDEQITEIRIRYISVDRQIKMIKKIKRLKPDIDGTLKYNYHVLRWIESASSVSPIRLCHAI